MTRTLPLSRRAQTARSSAIRDLLHQAKQPGMLSLAGGLPAPDLFPVAAIAEAATAALATDARGALQYTLTEGDPGFAAWASARTFGVVDPDRVIVTTGSQQALDLLGKILLDPGDIVVVESPAYLGALQTLRSYEATLVGIPVDNEGLRTDVLEDRLRDGLRPDLVYTNVAFQNPTGATLSTPRRRHLVELAEQYGFVVAEDDPYGELRFAGVAPEPLPDSDLVVRLRSVSKVLAPGFRLGWAGGSPEIIRHMVTAKQAADLHTSTLTQRIAEGVLTQPGWLDAHLAQVQPFYRDRRDALVEAMTEHLGENAVFLPPEGGMFVWARLGTVSDTTALLHRALAEGVAFVPGAAFEVDEPLGDQLRLSFATLLPAEFDEALSRLARAIAA